MEELIERKENIKKSLNEAIALADQAMKEWQIRTRAVTELQNELMSINSKITNFNKQ